jgi:translation initiation factor IF-2
MAEERMIRLSQAARQLNVSLSTIVSNLSTKGVKIDSNPNTKITVDQYNLIAKELGASLLDIKSLSDPPIPARTTQPIEPLPQTEKKIPVINDIPVVEPSKKNEPKEEKQPALSDNPSHKVPGLKVLGKIDLNPKKNTPPAQQENKGKQIEQPVLEKKTIPVEKNVPVPQVVLPLVEKPQIDKLPVEPSIPFVNKVLQTEKDEKPVVIKTEEKPIIAKHEEKSSEHKETIESTIEQVLPQKQPKETPVEMPVIEKQVQQVREVPVSSPEEEQAVEVVRAKGETLKGLTVLGKIDLSTPKPKSTAKTGEESDEEAKRKRKRKRKRIKNEKTTPTANPAANPQQPQAKNASPQGGNNQPKPNNGNANAKQPDKAKKQGSNERRNQPREEVTQKQIQDQIRQTLAKIGPNKGKAKKYRSNTKQGELESEGTGKHNTLKVTEFISANDLAVLMGVSVNEVISKCLSMGMFVSINQRLDAEAITFITDEFGFEVSFISAEDETSLEIEEVDASEDLLPRPPIVTIMGHVDHGKTSLLDYIRSANVAAKEAGGITQHIGAYDITTEDDRRVVFLDTPGHEAFTAMRARGARMTDVAVIVVAADDSVMPQTKEAINHALNAGVPIIIAINKVDKPGANPERIRTQLSEINILVEEWGGKYQSQEVSAKTGAGVPELLEKILLEADILELKANPNKNANGTVIEASLDKGRGYVTNVMVQNGTLKIGDIILAGSHFGRVKAMMDHRGNRLKQAPPATPVQVLGLNGAPQAGDKFNAMNNEREAKEIATRREQLVREQSIRTRPHLTIEEIGRRRALGNFNELNLIVKGDVDGSVEALADSLLKLSTPEIQIRIIHKGVGQIAESDILLASVSDAIIVGFQVRPSPNARKLAEQEKIQIKLYSIIYDAIGEIKDAMEGMLAPKVEEVIVGMIEVREVFKISKIGTIAGCYVLDGTIKRNNKVRIIRDGTVIHEGEIDSLKRFKDDVTEVKTGFECGLSMKSFNDIMVGDEIESFELKETKRTLT